MPSNGRRSADKSNMCDRSSCRLISSQISWDGSARETQTRNLGDDVQTQDVEGDENGVENRCEAGGVEDAPAQTNRRLITAAVNVIADAAAAEASMISKACCNKRMTPVLSSKYWQCWQAAYDDEAAVVSACRNTLPVHQSSPISAR